MEKLLPQLLEQAKKDKKVLIALKNTAISAQQYELAAELRNLEVELFPETEEEKAAKKFATEVSTVLRMVEIQVNHSTMEKMSYIIGQALKIHFDVPGKFSIEDAIEILEKAKKLFPNQN